MSATATLARLKARFQVAGYANADQLAVDTFVWACTGGMEEAIQRIRRYHEAQEPTLAEAMNDGLQRDGQPHVYASDVHPDDDHPF